MLILLAVRKQKTMLYGQMVKRPSNPGGASTIYIGAYPGSEIEMYRCHKCGTVVFEYAGNVETVVPGYHQSTLPLIKMCPNRNCKHKYCIRLGPSRDDSE